MIASSDSIESATETNSRIRLTNGGESLPRTLPGLAAALRGLTHEAARFPQDPQLIVIRSSSMIDTETTWIGGCVMM